MWPAGSCEKKKLLSKLGQLVSFKSQMLSSVEMEVHIRFIVGVAL